MKVLALISMQGCFVVCACNICVCITPQDTNNRCVHKESIGDNEGVYHHGEAFHWREDTIGRSFVLSVYNGNLNRS